jgi:single-stranded-DNA-specific exonuclease
MQPSRTRWRVHHIEQEQADRLAEQCGIHPLVARLLLIRGCDTPDKVRKFLEPKADDLYDPFLMDGMREAVETVRRTIRDGGKIRVYGDYDADGISSTSLMLWLLRELGSKCDYYIPHRVHEGYGLNKAALEKAKQDGVSLIVTVDTGISAAEEARYAAELGLDLVITDHHEPPAVLPEALAVLNPKKPGCPYPFKQLAGVGVAFKLAQALTGAVPERLAELAALGTIADLMPLVDENRTIVHLGLKRMQRTTFTGLAALFDVSGLDGKEISAGHIGFAVAPRINASGRLTSADAAVRLLTTEHEQEAYMLAKQLDELNDDRQRIVEETVEEALAQLHARYGQSSLPPVIICAGEGWNAGVIGIVAARILEKHYRPTLIFTIDPESGMAKGSARSIAGFDIHKALTECSDLLDHFGGHQAAAGLSLAAHRLDVLQERLNRLAESWLTEEDYIPLSEIDVRCGLDQCTVQLVEQLSALAPYGIGNRSPKLMIERAALKEARKIGKDGQHLKLSLTDGNAHRSLDAVGFGLGALHNHLSPYAKIDVIGELQINEWNGMRKPQLLIQDLRVNHLQVFDWRGLRPVRSSPPQMNEPPGQRAYAGLRDEAAFVIVDGAPHWMEIITGMFGERRIYRMDEDGELFGVNHHDGPPDEPLTDLVLVQLPRSKQQLRRMLQKYGGGLERICVWFADAEDAAAGCPPRERFIHVYAWLKQVKTWDPADAQTLNAWSSRTGLSSGDILFILNVFEELGFIIRNGGRYEFVPQPAPRDLSESHLYRLRNAGKSLAEEFMLMTSDNLLRTIQEHATA